MSRCLLLKLNGNEYVIEQFQNVFGSMFLLVPYCVLVLLESARISYVNATVRMIWYFGSEPRDIGKFQILCLFDTFMS